MYDKKEDKNSDLFIINDLESLDSDKKSNKKNLKKYI